MPLEAKADTAADHQGQEGRKISTTCSPVAELFRKDASSSTVESSLDGIVKVMYVEISIASK